MRTIIVSKSLPLCITTSSDQKTALRTHLLTPIVNQSQKNKASSVKAIAKLNNTNEQIEFKKPSHLCFWYGDMHVGIPSMYKVGTKLSETKQNETKKNEHNDRYVSVLYETKETYSIRMQNCFANRIWNDIYVKYKDEPSFEQYTELNKTFCNEILKVAEEEDNVIIIDHALWLLPGMLKKKINLKVCVSIMQPFPNVEVFRTLPNPKELLESLLMADYIEFQDRSYLENFIMTCEILLDATQRHVPYHMLNYNAKETKLGMNKIKSDPELVKTIISCEKCVKEISKYKDMYNGKKVIVCVGTADESITFANALMALESYIHKYGNKIALILLELPEGIRDTETDSENRRMLEYMKITYKDVTVDQYFPIEEHVYYALLSLASIGLFINERCAVNKPAMDFLIATNGEVNLITSMFAPFDSNFDTIEVNPKNAAQTAEAIRKCVEGYKQSASKYLEEMKNYTPNCYIKTFVDTMCDQTSQVKIKKDLTTLKQKYKESSNRILCLDYDGTLTSLVSNPQDAKPDNEITELLDTLAEKNKVCVVTGRDKETIDGWITNCNIEISAEHGQFYRKDGEWMDADVDLSWKNSAKQIINFFVERTPESFMEEKESALCFHYRKTDAKISGVQSKALKSALTKIFRRSSVEISEGKFIVEIRGNNVDKGVVVKQLMKECDFMLVAGDDTTDENMFNEALNHENMYSVIVGHKQSKAKYMLENVKAMRDVLKELSEI